MINKDRKKAFQKVPTIPKKVGFFILQGNNSFHKI